MARGSVQLARGDEPGPCRDRHPVRHEHVPDRAGPARPGDPGPQRGRHPGRRPLLGRLPGQPEDGRGGRGVQPGRRACTATASSGISTAAMVHLACAIPNLTYADRQPLPRPGRRHHHDAVGLPRRTVRAARRAPASGVELDRDKLDFYHRHFLDNVEVNEFYDPYRPGWVPGAPDLLSAVASGRSGSRRSTCSTTRRATAGRSVGRWSRRSSGALAPDVIGLQEVNRSIDQDHALAAAAGPAARLPGLPRVRDRSATGTRVTGTASSCSSVARRARGPVPRDPPADPPAGRPGDRPAPARRDHADGREHPPPPSRRPAGLTSPGSARPGRSLAFLDGAARRRTRRSSAATSTACPTNRHRPPVRRRLPVRDARGRDRRPGDVPERARRADDLPRPARLHRLPARPRIGPGRCGRASPSTGRHPTTRASTRAITWGWSRTSRSRPG